MNDLAQWIIFFLIAYLLGSIPFGYLLGRMQGIDIRQSGSKNIGATNAGRVLGKKWGIVCFVLDVLKGLLPALIAGVRTGLVDFTHWQKVEISTPAPESQFLWLGVGIAAILGHMFPLYLKLRGGKGVATAFGVMLGIYPFLTWPALGAVVVWLVVIRFSRMVSLASMAGALSLPAWLIVARVPRDLDVNPDASLFWQIKSVWPFLVVTVSLAALILIRHRANISRILTGTEPRIKRRRRSKGQSSDTSA